MTMDSKQLRNIIEGALLAAGEPLSLARLTALFDGALPVDSTLPAEDSSSSDGSLSAEDSLPADGAGPNKEALLAALEEIAADCEGRGFELKEVASGWRFQVRAETAPWVNRLWEEKPQKYSRAVLETLALVAYRQPITRGDIEEIRGVAVSSHIIKSLTEREWIKVVGHRDVPGRPGLYATTRQFLDYFNLKSLDELPSLGDIRDLEEINELLDLGDGPSPASQGQASDAIDEEMFDEQALEQQTPSDPTFDEAQGDDDMDALDQSPIDEETSSPEEADPNEIPEPGQPEQPELPGAPDAPELPVEPSPEPEISPEPAHPEIPNQPVTPEIPPAPDTPELESEDTDATANQGDATNN